jgi:hypothetical protein
MRCSCHLSHPPYRGDSAIRLAAAVAIVVLILVGGAIVMILNTRDLMEALVS